MPDVLPKGAKIPPQNIDAEVSLLGSVLIEDEVITAIADKIFPGDFYDKRHGTIYAAMVKLYEKHQPVDLLTLSNALKDTDELEDVGGSSYLTELTNAVPTAAHAEHYADIVAEKSMRRKLIKASEDIVNLSFGDGAAQYKKYLNKPKNAFLQFLSRQPSKIWFQLNKFLQMVLTALTSSTK
jgi:replicative DNA helicase